MGKGRVTPAERQNKVEWIRFLDDTLIEGPDDLQEN